MFVNKRFIISIQNLVVYPKGYLIAYKCILLSLYTFPCGVNILGVIIYSNFNVSPFSYFNILMIHTMLFLNLNFSVWKRCVEHTPARARAGTRTHECPQHSWHVRNTNTDQNLYLTFNYVINLWYIEVTITTNKRSIIISIN